MFAIDAPRLNIPGISSILVFVRGKTTTSAKEDTMKNESKKTVTLCVIECVDDGEAVARYSIQQWCECDYPGGPETVITFANDNDIRAALTDVFDPPSKRELVFFRGFSGSWYQALESNPNIANGLTDDELYDLVTAIETKYHEKLIAQPGLRMVLGGAK